MFSQPNNLQPTNTIQIIANDVILYEKIIILYINSQIVVKEKA